MSKGIALQFNENGDVDVKKETPQKPQCLIGDCDYIREGWICFSSGQNVWDLFRNPGWCPLFKWFRSSKAKEFKAEKAANERKVIQNL